MTPSGALGQGDPPLGGPVGAAAQPAAPTGARRCTGCDRPGRPYPGATWCDTCRPFPAAPVPDPTRTLDALLEAQAQRLAEARKADVLAQVSATAPDRLRRDVDTAILTVAGRGGTFTANHVRPLLPPLTPGPIVGARFNALARQGRIRTTGRTVPSSDPGTHGHRVLEWEAA